MRALDLVVLALIIIGGLNWLLVGLFGLDVVAAIFGGEVGPRSMLSRAVYVIVGLAALYALSFFPRFTETDRLNRSRRLN